MEPEGPSDVAETDDEFGFCGYDALNRMFGMDGEDSEVADYEGGDEDDSDETLKEAFSEEEKDGGLDDDEVVRVGIESKGKVKEEERNFRISMLEQQVTT
jgi:hypothetical protein